MTIFLVKSQALCQYGDMQRQKIFQDFSIDTVYQHILALEGVRNHYTAPDKLEAAANYISEQFRTYGLSTSEQVLHFEGLDFPFKNLEACLDKAEKPEILITSHYDTVSRSPGANDNASAVACMLEIARVLKNTRFHNFKVRFVSFTLEELHPVDFNTYRHKLEGLGIIDEDERFIKHSMHKAMKEFYRIFIKASSKGTSYAVASETAFKAIEKDLDTNEKELFTYLVQRFSSLSKPEDWLGKTGIVGSSQWVDAAVKKNQNIFAVFNLETIGYTSKQAYSQKLPSPLFKLLPRYKVNLHKQVGNFIAVVGDKNSRKIARYYCKECKKQDIDLPYVNIALPFTFETIAAKARDLLRSDHGPFWKQGIPALMLTDTANFRYPYYHTEADTIDKLDFLFMEKVSKALISSLFSLDETGFHRNP